MSKSHITDYESRDSCVQIHREESRSSASMSVEDTLRYFDNTVAALDLAHERTAHDNFAGGKYMLQEKFAHDKLAHGKRVYESESDLLSEIGYASGYTELSATSDGENCPKPTGVGIRRRKSRQNRNQRLQCDPILGDLESDSTNDGQLFGSNAVSRVKTRTNSGQRRQRERRRQRRQTVNRNSWTDSGLSLSKTDSQRSSHSENSPMKRGRSKTSPADIVIEGCKGAINSKNDVNAGGEKSTVHTDSGVSSPGLSVGSPVQEDCFEEKCPDESIESAEQGHCGDDMSKERVEGASIGFDLSTSNIEEKPLGSSSVLNSLDSTTKVDCNFIDIKPTNWQGVVNGTYTPKEKEIMHQVLQNARNSAPLKPEGSPQGSKFPLPPHLDYPLCMYRQDRTGKKERKSNGFMKGLKKLKQGIANKRSSLIVGDDASKTKMSHAVPCPDSQLPPSKPVDKKKGFLKKILKGDWRNKKQSNFQRGKFSSTRSFSGSVSQFLSRGSRARSQSVENLKNFFKRDRSFSMKRTNSSVSLSTKMTRSLSVSSLIGRRNAFMRQSSMVSIAGQFTRPSNGGFRRADSMRSIHGGYDIATRILEPRNMQEQANCFENVHFHSEQVPLPATDFTVPYRGGWRPSSRISRREPNGSDFSRCYDEGSVVAYSDCFDNEESCPCCFEDRYYDDAAYFNEHCDYSDDHYYDQRDIHDSRVTLANFDHRFANPHFTRAPSIRSMNNLPQRPQSHVANYYSPVNIRRDNRVVVAPLNVQITQERRAERRQLTRRSGICDSFV